MYRLTTFVLFVAFGIAFQQSQGVEVKVFDKDGKLCLYANLMVSFSVSYPVAGSEPKRVNFELPGLVNADESVCTTRMSMLKLTFGEGHSWSMNFAVNGEVYQADSVAFSYNLGDSNLFPDASSHEIATVVVKPHITDVDMNTCYSCESKDTIQASEFVTQTLRNVLIQAFVSDVEKCKSEHLTVCAADLSTFAAKNDTTTKATTTSTAAPVTNSTSTAAPVTTSTSTAAPVTTSTSTAAPVTNSTSTAAPVTNSTTTAAPVPTTTTTAAPVTNSTSTAAPVTTSTSTAAPVTTSTSTAAPVTNSTSTAAPVTNSTSTAAPVTTSTSTAAPVTTSTSAAPPTSTAPAPTLPSPTTGKYSIKPDENSTACLLASFGLRIGLQQANGNEMNLDPNVTVASGSCGVSSSELVLVSDLMSITFSFINDTKKFRLHALNVTGNTGTGVAFSEANTNLSLWEAALSSSYMCNTEQNYTITKHLSLYTFNLQVQPFGVKKGLFSTAQECSMDGGSILIPIIVGVVLALMILIVVIAYIIGRRRTYVGYQTL